MSITFLDFSRTYGQQEVLFQLKRQRKDADRNIFFLLHGSSCSNGGTVYSWDRVTNFLAYCCRLSAGLCILSSRAGHRSAPLSPSCVNNLCISEFRKPLRCIVLGWEVMQRVPLHEMIDPRSNACMRSCGRERATIKSRDAISVKMM